jgi:penicillin-binding protein 2
MLVFDQLKRGDRHLQVIACCVLLGLGVLVARLWYVQVVSSRQYQEDLETQSFRSVRLPAVRGKILDRNGVALAENQPRYNVDLYLEELSKLFQSAYTNDLAHTKAWRKQQGITKKLEASETSRIAFNARYRVVSNIVTQVSQIINQPLMVTEAQFRQHYDQRLALPMPIAENLSLEQVARFVERSVNISGVELEIQPMRTYPQKTAASHVLGYLQRDDSSLDDEESFFNYRLPDFRGRVGIEGNYDSELRGRAGSKSLLVNNLGYRQNENVWNQAQPGQNLILTIDSRIQKAAESALNSAGANTRGAVVVMDSRNGDLLAMVSAPAFDPNAFIPSISRAEYDKLDNPLLMPMVNRATYGAYPPGSIFKIIVALAALEAGTLNTNETLFNPGYFPLGRRHIRDTAPVGEYNFHRAFIKSSNTYFIHHGLKAGPRKIVEMGERFQLGESVNIMPRQESKGEFPTQADIAQSWFDGDTANLSIGQGPITVTPVQMAIMTAAVASGGKVFHPRLVMRTETQDTKEVTNEFVPGEVKQYLGVNPANLAIIREAMLSDVEDSDGTGWRAAVPGMRVCGKTGTAQITRGRKTIDYITWFVSYAPYDDPRYVVVVMVESGGSGGGTCAPVAQKIYQAIQKIENPAMERRTK